MIPSQMASYPSVSVVIEWENARLGRGNNTRAMLNELRAQLLELGPQLQARPEIIFVHEPAKVKRTLIEDTAGGIFSTETGYATTKIVPGEGLRYYEMKNLGAEHATGDILVFLDSDVVPEPGWLRNLLTPFSDAAVGVVAGNTYVPPKTVYSRAFALCWMFPLRAEDGPLQDWGALFRDGAEVAGGEVHPFANNIAFRRTVFLASKFGDVEFFRWQTGPLIRSLAAQGYGILHNPQARVRHPPPPNPKYFVSRALCEGHDVYLSYARTDPPRASLVRCAYWYYARSLTSAARDIRGQGKNLGLGSVSGIGAFVVAASFASVALAGFFLARYWPQLIRRHFAV
jgi:hypothetical protein